MNERREYSLYLQTAVLLDSYRMVLTDLQICFVWEYRPIACRWDYYELRCRLLPDEKFIIDETAYRRLLPDYLLN